MRSFIGRDDGARMWTWLKRWHRVGYRELWYSHYGGAHEGDKGCRREYDFLVEVTGSWHHMAMDERNLRLEAEELLEEAGIEPPTKRRSREFAARLSARRIEHDAKRRLAEVSDES